MNTSYENLLEKNGELKNKVIRLRNELEILNISHKQNIVRNGRRNSDPDSIRIYGQNRPFDGASVRNWYNTEESQIDGEQIPQQNEGIVNTCHNIENMKKSIKELKKKLMVKDKDNEASV